MINYIHQSLHNLNQLGFPSIFEGREVKVSVILNEGHYDVQINDKLIAQLKFDENRYTWCLAQGDLNDPDLVKEIGERIEARYN